MKKLSLLMSVLLLAPVVLSGCATKKYVEEQDRVITSRVDDVEAQVEENQTRLDQQSQEISQVDKKAESANQAAGEASKTAQEALQRAEEAGKLAEGKLLYETVLTDNEVKFGLESAQLSDGAKSALDAFAQKLKQENKGVYIEIQGHTDSTGSESYNHKLALERAETVKQYLNRKHGFPLHRMNVISYGESEPMVDNNNRENRAKNRRVSLVVLN